MILKKIINTIFGIQAAHNILWYLAIIRRVFVKPNFIPDAVSIALLGPGVINIIK